MSPVIRALPEVAQLLSRAGIWSDESQKTPSWSVMVGSSARSEREPFLFAIRSDQTRFVASVIIANRKVLLSSTDRASRLHPSAGGRRHAPEPERLVSIRPIDVQLRPTGLLQVPELLR